MVGEYGTALWLDSQFESPARGEILWSTDGLERAGVSPNPAFMEGSGIGGRMTGSGLAHPNQAGWQRLAGKVLPRPNTDLTTSLEEKYVSQSGAQANAIPGMDRAGEAEGGERRDSGGGTTVFGLHERSEAYLIGMDEEIGRVVVAWKDGGLSVCDYMPD